jgi:two-component system CheB/CheR fusion protein
MKPPQAAKVPPLRIFVVENHADTLKCLETYLKSLGHTVLSARTMEQALQALPQAHCDVLLSDIGLPDGDGWQLLERMREATPAYAVAMSGFGMTADHERSAAAGFRHHLLKPFLPEDLDVLLADAAEEKKTRASLKKN